MTPMANGPNAAAPTTERSKRQNHPHRYITRLAIGKPIEKPNVPKEQEQNREPCDTGELGKASHHLSIDKDQRQAR
jgi:hypothetical protein